MNYNLVYADERTKFFIARYKTRGEAEAARENLAYNTNEFSFEKIILLFCLFKA